MTEKEKAQTISKMIAKTQKKIKREVKLVVAKGGARGTKGRPKGVKGRYKVTLHLKILIIYILMYLLDIQLKFRW